mgnify:CR=1 FL=1
MKIFKPFILYLLLLSIVLLSHFSFAQHFQSVWTGNPFQPMNIVVVEASAYGIDLEAGDEIALYDIGELGNEICVGTSILSAPISTENPLIIVLSADEEINDGVENGFIFGHTMKFRVWDSSKSFEIDYADVIFDPLFEDTYTPLETALVSINSCKNTDVDCDCDVDIIDVTIVGYRYGTVEGDNLYDERYDFDHDGDIDILDVTTVAYDFLWFCE